MASIHNLALSEEMYAKYLADPESCEASWRFFFEGMEWGAVGGKGALSKEMRIAGLIDAYRTFGHLLAHVNPIETKERTMPHQLSLETLGFRQAELKELFPTAGLLDKSEAPLEAIIEKLTDIYGKTVSIEYMYTTIPEMKKWLQEQIETTQFHPAFSAEKKKKIYNSLSKSTLFETFLHTRYVGQKRFSLEGGETLIPILQEVLETGATNGMKEVVLGMAHRGRLNVLVNIMNKSMGQVFGEFEDFFDPEMESGTGDVKYHKGFSTNVKTASGEEIHISLTSNPSHLESVCPVVEGKVKARQILTQDQEKKGVVPLLIHGDASIAGQGVVYETMQLFDLAGYGTGGTIHIVINNQIGFTTLPQDSRSTPYCTSIAGAFSAPVFHVNAEDPEGCVYAAKLALLLRQKYHTDVFIDMNGYRKFGHNEGDEPAFTQPLEYELIRKKRSIREIYLQKLVEEKVITEEEALKLEKEFKEELGRELEEVKRKREPISDEAFGGVWEGFRKGDLFEPAKTHTSREKLVEAATLFSKMPQDFSPHPKVAKLFQDRLQMVKGGQIDYACAEHLAFATLLLEGVSVRLAGQDVRRGTFSHRHALWVDQKTGHMHIPLAHMKEGQGRFDIFDSPLSEYGALGFEFGYSIANPQALVMWEAQYGDFVNGAQITIDQYISAAEQKWNRHSGLVMLLPHGYEGSGPEHSSARLERFLQLSGEQNIQVVYPTTPAQLFHLLRRQVVRPIRKPLVVMTPKGMLRHPLCRSGIEECVSGAFHEVIDDTIDKTSVKRVLLCSGKIYYDLLEERKKRGTHDVALVRIEQLYPLDEKGLERVLQGYGKLKEVFWVQEEPENMGAWWALQGPLRAILAESTEFKQVTRKQSASVAVGSHALHVKEQQELMRRAYE